MAETAARHVNTMEAHHAPNWSRKHHVDGAHDKPSATSGSHGRRPHNATKPKTKHAPIDNESWSHADARAARLGRTESLSGYLFGSAFSAPERQRPAEENRRLWPEEHDEDAATYFTPFDEGRSGVRPDGPETTSTAVWKSTRRAGPVEPSTGENKFHLEFQGNHEPHDGECEAVRLPGEDHRPIDEDEPLYAGNVRLAEVLGERKESFDLTPRFYGPDEARAHVLERDEPQPEFDVAGHVRLKPALHEDKPDLLAELVENGLKEGLKLRMDHLDAIDDEVAAIYAEPAVVAKVPTREELQQRHPSLPPPIYSDRFSTHDTRPHDPHERDVQSRVQSILKGKGTKEEKAIAINQLDVPQETKNRALQDLENDATLVDEAAPAGVPDDRRSVHAADRYGKHPTEAKRVPLAAQHSRATLEQMTQNDEGLEAETLETSRDGQRLQPMRKPLAAVPEDATAPVPVEPLTPEAAVDRPEPALTARVASLRPSPADEEKEPEFGGAGLAAAKARDEEKEERRKRRKKKKSKSDDASADSQKRKRKHKSKKKRESSSSSTAAPAIVVEDAPAPVEAPGPTADQAAPGDESTCVIA